MADEGRAEGKARESKSEEDNQPTGDALSREEKATTRDCDNDQTPTASREGTPPPLPPRPFLVPPGSASRPSSSRALLPSRATTALSLADVHVQSQTTHDETRSSPTSRPVTFAGFGHGHSHRGSDGDDTTSVMSYAPTMEMGGEMESIMGDVEHARATPGMKPLTPLARGKGVDEEDIFPADPAFDDAFEREFDELDDITSDGLNEG
jgi:hypothetical protein